MKLKVHKEYLVIIYDLINLVDPKKQIYISKIDYENSPKIVNKSGEEIIMTHGHIKNLRKKRLLWE